MGRLHWRNTEAWGLWRNSSVFELGIPKSILVEHQAMPRRFTASNYGFLAATIVWTLGWLGSAALALDRLSRSADLSTIVAVVVSVAFGSAGLWIAVRTARLPRAVDPDTDTTNEPWLRRITGWFAAIVWSVAGVAWNFGVIAWLLRMAHEGRGWFMLILIPWSLIGWLLMVVLFVGVRILFDSLINLFRNDN